MQSLFKRKFFLILKRFFALPRRSPPKADEGWALPRRSPDLVGTKAGVVIAVSVIAVVIFLFPPSVVSAQLGDMETVSGGLMQGLSNLALGLGEFFIKMSIFFLRFFIALAQYNNYIDSPVVKLGWLMVRDVVNMFFVVILLVIAIGTILGIEQYQWNKTLVKMILSAVFVNFSNLISQLFIDAAHIFTLTFASAISATAGGNLINMFHFEKIYAIVTGKNDPGGGGEGFNLMARTLVASIVAMLFALLAMLIMGAYAIMMLLRMTVLWVLIILSPLAFLFIALPQTQNRYAEWWKEFSNYVVLGPTIAFFMWLAFATAGSGTLGTDIGITDSMLQAGTIDSVGALTLSAVTTWENMANFLVAIVLLFVGLQEVQKLNVAGGSVASKAKDFFGKVATIATGYAAGRWLVGKGKEWGEKGGKGALWYMPFVGGRNLSTRWKNEMASVQNWWYGKAAGLTKKGMEKQLTLGEKKAELESKQEAATMAGTEEERKRLTAEAEALKGVVGALEEEVKKETGGGGLIGYLARRDVGLEKQLKKSEGQLEIRKKLAFKRMAGDSGGLLFNRSEGQIRDQYRYERGALEVEEMRSSAKDKALGAEGKTATMAMRRYRGGEFLKGEGEPGVAEGEGYKYKTMADEIAKHGRALAKADSIIKAVQGKAELDINVNAKAKADAVRAEEEKLDKELFALAAHGEQELTAKLASAKDERDAKMQELDAKFNPQIEEKQKRLQAGNLKKKDRTRVKRELVGLEDAKKKETDAIQQKLQEAENSLKTYKESDEAKNVRQSEEYLKKERDVNEKKAKLEESLRKVPGAGGFMAAQQAAFVEGMQEATKTEMQAGILGLAGQQQLLADINLSEQAKKGAEEFVKTIKEAKLQEQFTEAAEKMNEWLKLGGEKLKQKLEEARRGEYGGLVAAMARAQVAKEQEEDKDLARRTAEDAAYDAFVAKPRYGTISPSTAFSEYMKKKGDEFRRLERVAAYKKATDTLLHLQGLRELDVGQKAQLAAAVSFLTEEAWVDDKGEYIFNMLEKLRKGELDDNEEEKKKWQGMAKLAHKIGWIENGEDGVPAVDANGNIHTKAKIRNTYDREQAADLQNLAMTGMDTDLVVAHKTISRVVDANTKRIKVTTESVVKDEVDKAIKSGEYEEQTKEAVTEAETKTNSEFTLRKERAEKDAEGRARKEAKQKSLNKEDTEKFVAEQIATASAQFTDEARNQEVGVAVNSAVREAVAKAAKEKIKQKVKEAVDALRDEKNNKLETNYWKVADAELKKLGIDGLKNRQELKDRYDKHSDLLQFAARTFKKNALDTGHEELGMNQDFDDEENIYRFQTTEEGRQKLRADRLKIDRAKLLNGDQYHSNGTLDYKTYILDDFLEDTMGITIGKVTKAIELSRVPERSLKGYFYVHKNEDAQVISRTETDGTVRRYAVLGADDKAKEKFADDGDVDLEDQRNHMIARGMIAHMKSGWRGAAIGLHKLFGHISEKDAQQGKIYAQIGDQSFKTVQELAKFVRDKIQQGDKKFMEQFNKSNNRGQEAEVLRLMEQIMREAPKADFSSSDEENEATNPTS